MTRAVTLLLVVLCLAGLAPGRSAAAAPEVPESQRSRAVVARVTPDLKAAVRDAGFDWGTSVFLRIFKQEAVLEVWLEQAGRFGLFRTYPVCRYSGALGPKLREGDGQAPEGFYAVPPERLNPNSRYHLSFNLGYPNAYDRAHGRTGGYLMVHGDCVSAGCFAMARHLLPAAAGRNAPIEEIWTLVRAAVMQGQPAVPVHVFPFRMTEENMARHAGSKWAGFWRNLREGYRLFEATRRPPAAAVKARNYVFSIE